MTYSLRFASWVLLGMLATACSKKDDPATPTTGGLSGTVSPVGSITQVTAKNAGSLTFITRPDATSGTFNLTNLAAGPYTLSFTMASGYRPAADRTISIVAGQTAAAGTVQATSDGTIKSGTMSWTVNGQTYTTTALSGSIDRLTGSFSVSGKSTTGNQVDELDLGLGTTFFGTGTYGFNSAYNSATYQRITGGITTFSYPTNSSSNGTLTITQYDEVTGKATGTFGFVGTASSSSVTITNGSFSVQF